MAQIVDVFRRAGEVYELRHAQDFGHIGEALAQPVLDRLHIVVRGLFNFLYFCSIIQAEILHCLFHFAAGLAAKFEKLFILSLLIHNLTIIGRDIISSKVIVNEGVANELYCLNEIQHKVSGFMMNLLNDVSYPEDAFAIGIFTISEKGGLEESLAKSIEYTLAAVK